MKITKVEVLKVKTTRATWRPVFCRIYTDEGIVGLGESGAWGFLEASAQAMITMSEDQEERERMGEAGYKRVNAFYRIEQMKDVYREIYKELSEKQKLTWTEEPFGLRR